MQIAESPKFPEPIFSPIAAPEEEGRKDRAAEVGNFLVQIISLHGWIVHAWGHSRRHGWGPACMSVQPCHTLHSPAHSPTAATSARTPIRCHCILSCNSVTEEDSSFSACAARKCSTAPHCMHVDRRPSLRAAPHCPFRGQAPDCRQSIAAIQ